jgi:hypothetical protein
MYIPLNLPIGARFLPPFYLIVFSGRDDTVGGGQNSFYESKMSFISRRGSHIGASSGDKEKDKDKEFMAKMLNKKEEKKHGSSVLLKKKDKTSSKSKTKKKSKKKTGGDDDSDVDDSDSDTDSELDRSSSSSSSDSDESETGGRHLKRSHSISSLLTLGKKKGSSIKGHPSSSTSSSVSTDVVKVRFNILLKLIVGLPSSANDRPVYVAWKRGRKRQNRGETKHIRSTGGVVMWGESIWLEVTMAAHLPASSSSSSSSISSSSSTSSSATGASSSALPPPAVAGSSPSKSAIIVPAAAASSVAKSGAPQFDSKNLMLSIKREVRRPDQAGHLRERACL